MIINTKSNDITQNILGTEAVPTCKRIRNSMTDTGIKRSLFEIFYGEKSKIIGSFSEFGHIT